MSLDIAQFAGSYVRLETSMAVASYWVLPDGVAVDKAFVALVYFDYMEKAQAFAKQYDASPEMACAMTLVEFDELVAKRRRANRR